MDSTQDTDDDLMAGFSNEPTETPVRSEQAQDEKPAEPLRTAAQLAATGRRLCERALEESNVLAERADQAELENEARRRPAPAGDG